MQLNNINGDRREKEEKYHEVIRNYTTKAVKYKLNITNMKNASQKSFFELPLRTSILDEPAAS